MARFGIHLSISGGVAQAAARALELGCDTFQIFSRNPRTLKAKPIDPDDAVAFRAAVGESGIRPSWYVNTDQRGPPRMIRILSVDARERACPG